MCIFLLWLTYLRSYEEFLTGMIGTMKILLRMLSLYMSIDVEFNADSEYVHDYEVYFILKRLLGQKLCFWDSF